MQIIHWIDDIKLLFRNSLNNREKILRTVLSDGPLVYLAWEDFSEKYMQDRCSQGIFLKSLRLSGGDIDLSHHMSYEKYNKEVRVAPSDIANEYSLVIWDNYVAIINYAEISGKIIDDYEYAHLMKQRFDFIWSRSL